jgi:hypothetical protein
VEIEIPIAMDPLKTEVPERIIAGRRIRAAGATTIRGWIQLIIVYFVEIGSLDIVDLRRSE